MKIELKKTPKKPIIIEGFPGFGLIGTIATEFLIEHLKAELIGEFIYDELPSTIAIHKSKLVKPMAIYYSKEKNIVILHTILNTSGFEWIIADNILNLAKKLNASEIISLEGVASPNDQESGKVYYYGNHKLKDCGAEEIKESIIIGVTAAVMLRFNSVNCLFAETQSNLPDSKASAKIIEILDKYLGLKVDYEPLLRQAEEFEKKIKGIIQQSSRATEEKQKKDMSYLG